MTKKTFFPKNKLKLPVVARVAYFLFISLLSQIAESMVKKLGMSEKVGLRVFEDNPNGGPLSAASELGPATCELIDSEVNR